MIDLLRQPIILRSIGVISTSFLVAESRKWKKLYRQEQSIDLLNWTSEKLGAQINSRTSVRKATTIGLFVATVQDRYENAVIRGAFDVLHKADVRSICFTSGALRSYHGFEAQRNVLYDLVNGENVDGLIILGTLGHLVPPAEMEQFCTRYRPLPMVAVAMDMKGVPALVIESSQGMRAILNHLIEKHGSRRIAFLRGPAGQLEAEQRYQTYQEVLAENHLPCDPELVVQGDYTYQSGMIQTEKLFDEKLGDFDALVCANDSMALGALEVMQRRGVKVPEQVALTGFDDTDEARFSLPPLTTVHQPAFEQGQQAAGLILSLLNGTEIPARTSVPVRMVVRQSCGCPALSLNSSVVAVPALENHLSKAERQAKIIFDIVESAHQVKIDFPPSWARRFVEAFFRDLEQANSHGFLNVLSEYLGANEMITQQGDGIWQRVLLALRRGIVPGLTDRDSWRRADDLWHQAQIFIGEKIGLLHAQFMLQAEHQLTNLRQVGEALAMAHDMPGLLSVLIAELPRLNIAACFLSLYEDPKHPAGWAKLIFAYDERGRFDLAEEGIRFPAVKLLPEGMQRLPQRQVMVVEALYAKEDQLGFILFDVEPQYAHLCDALRDQISVSLWKIILLEQRLVAEQALWLERQEIEKYVQEQTIELIQANRTLQKEIVERKRIEEMLRQGQEHEQRFAESLRTLLQVTNELSRSRSLDDLCRHAIELGQRALGFDRLSIWLVAEDRETMQGTFGVDEAGNIRDEHHYSHPIALRPMMVEIIHKGVTSILNEDHPLFNDRSEIVGRGQLFAVGLWDGAEMIGCLNSDNLLSGREFAEQDQELLELFASVLGHLCTLKRVQQALSRLTEALEQRVVERTAELETKNRELETLTYSVSHDLRSPLRGIDGYSSLLLEEYQDALHGAGQQYLKMIRLATSQMHKLLKDLSTYLSFEQRAVQNSSVYLPSIIQNLLSSFFEVIQNCQIQVMVNIPFENIFTDEKILSLALENLFDNSLKFTKNSPQPKIEIGGRETEEGCILWVKDNGIGFDMKYHDRIFELFQHLNHVEDYPGAGIGLAVVRKALQCLGGEAWAESSSGEGAIFFLEIPKSE
jgi:DNA-binding LacI/PurR family transcriptional regulator/signal transduction histidine kinase